MPVPSIPRPGCRCRAGSPVSATIKVGLTLGSGRREGPRRATHDVHSRTGRPRASAIPQSRARRGRSGCQRVPPSWARSMHARATSTRQSGAQRPLERRLETRKTSFRLPPNGRGGRRAAGRFCRTSLVPCRCADQPIAKSPPGADAAVPRASTVPVRGANGARTGHHGGAATRRVAARNH